MWVTDNEDICVGDKLQMLVTVNFIEKSPRK